MKGIKWTDEETEYLKNNWHDKPIKEILKTLGRTKNAVTQKAYKLELIATSRAAHKTWSKKEMEYLEDKWGSVSMQSIAKKLNRTPSAIQQKASKMGLGPFLEAGDHITLNQLMVALMGTQGGESYTRQQWADKGMPVKTKRVKNSTFKVINIQDFWDWAFSNSTIIDFSKLEPLLLGEEPKWLEDQRKADIENRYYKKTPWTLGEDKKLKSMLNRYQYNYRELSLNLRRTEGAIKRRIVDLKIMARPIKMSNHNPWTDKETELLIDLYKKGHSRNTMANYIDRSSQACSGKVERLIKEGALFPRSEFRISC